jgi:hypothetical protein
MGKNKSRNIFRVKVFDDFTPIADTVIKNDQDMKDFYKALKKKMM